MTKLTKHRQPKTSVSLFYIFRRISIVRYTYDYYYYVCGMCVWNGTQGTCYIRVLLCVFVTIFNFCIRYLLTLLIFLMSYISPSLSEGYLEKFVLAIRQPKYKSKICTNIAFYILVTG